MDINELNKKQLILLTLLITFVVSIATGIVTVSLMKQMPTSVPQTINNIIQRTIEKVSPSTNTTPVSNTPNENNNSISLVEDGEALVPIYPIVEAKAVSNSPITISDTTVSVDTVQTNDSVKELGQGIIISDIGLILVDSNILTDKEKYRVVLNKKDFEASILKKFSNGFTVLKIITKNSIPEKIDSTKTPSVDKIQ